MLAAVPKWLCVKTNANGTKEFLDNSPTLTFHQVPTSTLMLGSHIHAICDCMYCSGDCCVSGYTAGDSLSFVRFRMLRCLVLVPLKWMMSITVHQKVWKYWNFSLMSIFTDFISALSN